MLYVRMFLLSFIIVYLFYLVTVVLQKKKYEEFRKSNQVMYFVKRYKLDANKINIKKFIRIISLTNSLIISLSFTIVIKVSNIYLMILLGFFIMLPLMLICYSLIGLYLKKECLK